MSWGLLYVKQMCEVGVFVFVGFVEVDYSIMGVGGIDDRDGEGRKQYKRGGFLEICIGGWGVVVFFVLFGSDKGSRLVKERVIM